MKHILSATIVCLLSCNNPVQQSSPAGLQTVADFIGTGNWQVINGTDTSYIFFSRQIDNSFKTYEYTLFKGDSVNTDVGAIAVIKEAIYWNLFHKTLVFDKVEGQDLIWRDASSTTWVLKKASDSTLLLETTNHKMTLRKTLPLSTFLARAKYDYNHGSKLVDSAEVKPRAIKR